MNDLENIMDRRKLLTSKLDKEQKILIEEVTNLPFSILHPKLNIKMSKAPFKIKSLIRRVNYLNRRIQDNWGDNLKTRVVMLHEAWSITLKGGEYYKRIVELRLECIQNKKQVFWVWLEK